MRIFGMKMLCVWKDYSSDQYCRESLIFNCWSLTFSTKNWFFKVCLDFHVFFLSTIAIFCGGTKGLPKSRRAWHDCTLQIGNYYLHFNLFRGFDFFHPHNFFWFLQFCFSKSLLSGFTSVFVAPMRWSGLDLKKVIQRHKTVFNDLRREFRTSGGARQLRGAPCRRAPVEFLWSNGWCRQALILPLDSGAKRLWLATESYVWLRPPALTQMCEQYFDCFISVW